MQKKRYTKKLRDEYTLRIMRDSLREEKYQLKEKELIQYGEIFKTCPYAANVFLVLLEIGEGESILLPSSMKEKVLLLEHLIDIRFFNPFVWQIGKVEFEKDEDETIKEYS